MFRSFIKDFAAHVDWDKAIEEDPALLTELRSIDLREAEEIARQEDEWYFETGKFFFVLKTFTIFAGGVTLCAVIWLVMEVLRRFYV